MNMIVYRSTTVKSLFPGFCNILLLVATLGIAIRHKLTICSLYLRCLGQLKSINNGGLYLNEPSIMSECKY